MSEKTVVRKSGEGDAFWMLGGLYEVLLSSDETNGASTVMRITVPVNAGPPPHSHECFETIYVVDGTAKFHIGGEILDAGPGSIVYIPPGTVETFEPTTTATVVINYSPGGMEKFFAEAGERAAKREIPPAPTSAPDVERLTQLGAKYGLHIQPPPRS
jgi:quercetin dioxygenase-like cupin family protein